MANHPVDRGHPSCGPGLAGADAETVPGHAQCVPNAGDSGGQWLSEADGSGAAHGGPVLPRATAFGGGWLLQCVQ